MKTRFGINAAAVTASTAARLERGLFLDQALFDAHPCTLVSLDYIKAQRRREDFARDCPPFVIVDEAHSCTGTHQGKQHRNALLQSLSRRDTERAMILLIATPHSGDEEDLARLLALISPAFGRSAPTTSLSANASASTSRS